MSILKKINYTKAIPMLFFVIYFIVGCFIFNDYGVGWDEEAQRQNNGKPNIAYIVTGDEKIILNCFDKYHGPAWEIFLGGTELLFNIENPSDVYVLRHFLNFNLFFIGTLFLFLTFKKLEINLTLNLFGCLFYILMPRILEDSFINSKDTVLLSVVSISNYFFIVWTQKKTYKWLFLFAVVSGAAIAVRIMGVLIPIFSSIVFFLISENKSKGVFKAVIYLLSTYFFMIVLWPVMWEGPIYHFIQAFKEMSKFPWGGMNFYLGEYVWAMDLPWHYLPIWFIITTPIFLIILFVVALLFFIKKAFHEFFIKKKRSFLVLFSAYQIALFFAPFVMVAVFNSSVYDGWRHVFFVAAPFILVVIIGLKQLFETDFFRKIKVVKISYTLLFLGATYLLYWNVKNHPFQNVYFNSVANNMYNVKQSFEMDYWGLAYKQGLEKIIKQEKGDTVFYCASNFPGYLNQYTITTHKNIVYVDSIDSRAKYYITNYRWHPQDYNLKKKDSIVVNGNEIIGIYSLKKDE